jgi:transposase
LVRDLSCGGHDLYLELFVLRVASGCCGKVKGERLVWLADNPFYTKRFAWLIGRQCRAATITDVACEYHLHWETVKELEKQYMREQLRRTGKPGPS